MGRMTGQGLMTSVLVVDDDLFSHDLLRHRLAQLGLTDVQVAQNGRDAEKLLDSMPSPPDVIICDIFMPEMDGIEFIAVLVKKHFTGGLILMTGVDPDILDVAQNIAELQGLHVLGCFTKPMTMINLSIAINLLDQIRL